MKRTRIWSMLLAASLLISAVACSSGTATAPPGNSGAPSSGASAPSTAGDSPEQQEPLKFTYWLPLHANISPFANNFGETMLAKNWQEATGVELTFEHPSGTSNDQMIEALNIMFASGDYPDMIQFEWRLYPGGVEKLYNEGIIYQLDEALAEHAPNFSARLAGNPEWNRLAKEDDGSIYKIPMLMDDEILPSASGPIIRSDLAEKHGIDPMSIETVADWDAYLEAIREDVEIPMIFQWQTMIGMWPRAWHIAMEFYNDDGVIKYGAAQPEYRDYLAQMNDWYTRGLLDRNFTTTDRNAVDTNMSAGLAGATHGAGGQQLGAYIPLLQEKDPEWNLMGIRYPTVDGAYVKHNNSWLIKSPGNVAVTTATDNLAGAVAFLDYMYSEEGAILANFGIEGESFEYVDGIPTYTERITKPDNGKTFAQELSNWTFANYNGPTVQSGHYIRQYYELQQQKDALTEWTKLDDSKNLSPLTMNAEEASEYALLYNQIKSYVDECTQLFIIGDKPLSEFDSFVQEIQDMNLERAIEIYQNALDRFNRR